MKIVHLSTFDAVRVATGTGFAEFIETTRQLAIGREMKHHIVNHQEQFVDVDVHTNTIAGFGALLKLAWYGSHHLYTTGFIPLYVAERCYVYNYRHLETIFWKFLNGSMILLS